MTLHVALPAGRSTLGRPRPGQCLPVTTISTRRTSSWAKEPDAKWQLSGVVDVEIGAERPAGLIEEMELITAST
jgi:hypothetical protein